MASSIDETLAHNTPRMADFCMCTVGCGVCAHAECSNAVPKQCVPSPPSTHPTTYALPVVSQLQCCYVHRYVIHNYSVVIFIITNNLRNTRNSYVLPQSRASSFISWLLLTL